MKDLKSFGEVVGGANLITLPFWFMMNLEKFQGITLASDFVAS